jgi:excisionase family DNA binding protein
MRKQIPSQAGESPRSPSPLFQPTTSSRQLSASTNPVRHNLTWRETVEASPKILLSFKEVIEVTGLSRPTLYRQMRAGQLGFVKVGRRTLFRPADLQAFIESHIKAPAETANRTV